VHSKDVQKDGLIDGQKDGRMDRRGAMVNRCPTKGPQKIS